jgi:hypothetical protein
MRRKNATFPRRAFILRLPAKRKRDPAQGVAGSGEAAPGYSLLCLPANSIPCSNLKKLNAVKFRNSRKRVDFIGAKGNTDNLQAWEVKKMK